MNRHTNTPPTIIPTRAPVLNDEVNDPPLLLFTTTEGCNEDTTVGVAVEIIEGADVDTKPGLRDEV
jgi:hypothetical protein